MNNNIKCNDEDFAKFISEAFASKDGPTTVTLKVTGSSMLPFLADKRDTVNLTPFSGKAKKGDILFYKRDNGKCVLHRVIKVNDNSFDFIGDTQTAVEHGINKDNVLAVCSSATRKGKLVTSKSPIWLFFKYVWINIIPLRLTVMNFISKLKK